MAEGDAAAFLRLMRELAAAPRRDGAFGCTLMQGAADPEGFVETWFERSRAQHLRHHERVSDEDRLLQERVRTFHRSEAPPAVRHFLPVGGDDWPCSCNPRGNGHCATVTGAC